MRGERCEKSCAEQYEGEAFHKQFSLRLRGLCATDDLAELFDGIGGKEGANGFGLTLAGGFVGQKQNGGLNHIPPAPGIDNAFIQPTTRDQFQKCKQDDATIQNRDWQQIENRQIHTKKPQKTESVPNVFSSTRRGGFHRCGRGPCPVFTLARMGPNGEDPHSISFHETHEWTPCLMPDGRLLYSRWDYVDRNGVLYQHLWTARPDGGGVRIYYGNNTWNPCGTWEARPVPDSTKVMAIAGPHHAMAAGSVVLIDTLKGIDGTAPSMFVLAIPLYGLYELSILLCRKEVAE